jgi:hypothetical protein
MTRGCPGGFRASLIRFQHIPARCVARAALYPEEFLDYLMRKDPGIKMAYLPFQGRNRVLYHTGHDR